MAKNATLTDLNHLVPLENMQGLPSPQTFQLRRGLASEIPAAMPEGELFLTTDTHALYAGTGSGRVAVGGGGGGGTPGGADTNVQFNDADIFGGDAGFTFDKTKKQLTFSSALAGSGSFFQASGAGAVFLGVGGTLGLCGMDAGEDMPNQLLLPNLENGSNGIKIIQSSTDSSGAVYIGWHGGDGFHYQPPYRQQITVDVDGIATATPDSLLLESSGVGSNTFLIGGATGACGIDINSYKANGIAMLIAEPAAASGGILIQDAANTGPRDVMLGVGNSVGTPTRFIEITDVGGDIAGINLQDNSVGGSIFMTADFTGIGNAAGEGILVGNTHVMVLSGDGITPFSIEIGTGTDKLAFLGKSPAVVQPTVTGSRGGNAALASLLTALAAFGLIVDGTS